MDENNVVSFRVANDDLSSAVSWVARNLPSKPVMPVLKGVLITADAQGLEIAGYDYEVSTQVRIPAEVITEGRIAVAGKLIADITATLPNKEVELVCEGSKVVLTCGASRFELPLIPIDDYPTLPELPKDTGSVNPSLFAQAVTQVAAAASRDETLPMLTGVHMEINGNKCLMATTDRFRMAVRSFEWNCSNDAIQGNFLIPSKTLVDAAKTLDALVTEDIEIAVGTADDVATTKLFGIRADNRKTSTRLLDAQFPNFRPLLPKTHKALATVAIPALLDALKRVTLVADRNAQIRLEFSEGSLVLSAGGSDAGHAEEQLDCAFAGEPIITAFNPQYLRDGLSVIRSERVVFGFTEPSRPVVLFPEPEELPEADEQGVFPAIESEFLYLLMPVRVPS